MSLINQVLQDLERRHGRGVEMRELVRAVRPAPRLRTHRMVWIVVSGCAGAALLLWVLFRPHVAPAPGSWTTATAPGPAEAISQTAPAVDAQFSRPPTISPGPSQIPVAAPRAAAVRPSSLVTLAARPEDASARAEREDPQATGQAETSLSTTAPELATTADVPPDLSGASAPMAANAEPPASPVARPGPSIQKQVRPPSQRERAESETRRGLAALQIGDVAEAEDSLHQALTIDPLADKARQALVGLYLDRGRSEDAERLLDERLTIDNRHAGFAMALARLQLARGANADALATLERSARSGEGSAGYQAILASAYSRVGQHKEAAERYKAAAQLAPQTALWLLGMGVELKADQRPAEARAAFQRARDVGGLNSQLASFVDQQLSQLR